MVMFSIGLRVSGAELLNILRGRALFVRTLFANCFLIPSTGFLLVHAFPLTPETRIGTLLLAAIPGTPIALQFTRQAKTRLAFAAALTFVLSGQHRHDPTGHRCDTGVSAAQSAPSPSPGYQHRTVHRPPTVRWRVGVSTRAEIGPQA